MTPCALSLRTFCLWGLCLLLCWTTLPVCAQPSPDEMLIGRARVAVQQQLYGDAVPVLETFRQQFPASKYQPEATVLLFKCYLALGRRTDGEPLWTLICQRWPKSDTLWQAAEAYFVLTAPTMPDKAFAMLDAVTTRDLLPPNSTPRVQLLRLNYYEKSDPAKFISEATAIITATGTPVPLDDLRWRITVAGRLYPVLLTAGKYDEAKAISTRVQALIAQQHNPNGLQDTDLGVYLTGLERVNTTRFLSEALPVVERLASAATRPDLQLPVQLAAKVYVPLLQLGRGGEAQRAHETVLKRCAELSITDWPVTDTAAYLRGRLTTLEATQPELFLTEALQLIRATSTTTNLEDLRVPTEITARVYPRLFTLGRATDATQAHEALQQAYARLNNPNNWAWTETNVYARARLPYLESTQPDTMVREVTASLAAARTVPELQLAYDFLARAYIRLTLNGQFEAAKTLHESFQTTCGTFQNPNNWQAGETFTYRVAVFGGWEKLQPQQCVTAGRALLAAVPDAKTWPELQLTTTLAPRIYLALCAAGSLEDAQRGHEALQRLLPTVGQAEQAKVEQLGYLTARLGYCERTSLPQFLTEALPFLTGGVRPGVPNEAAFLTDLARRVYGPLVTLGRGSEITAVHEQLQALLAKSGTPEQQQADTLNYQLAQVNALEKPQPQLFLTQGRAVLVAAKTAKTPTELQQALALAPRVYLALCQNGQLDDALALHDGLQATLKTLNQPDQSRVEAQGYLTARLAYWERVDPTRFVTEALPQLALETRTVAPGELPFVLDLARRVYGPLYSVNRADDATRLHVALQPLLAKWGTLEQRQGEQAQFINARFAVLEKQQPVQFLTQASAFVSALTGASAVVDLQVGAGLTPRLYPPLITAGKLAEAQRVHEALITALRAANLPDLAQKDEQSYQTLRLSVLEKSDPAQFVTVAQTLMTFDKPQTATELIGLQDLARRMYVPLFAAGRQADAKAVHERLKTALLQAKLPDAVQADEFQYQTLALALLEKTQPAQFAAAGRALVAGVTATSPAADLRVAASLTPRLYPTLVAAGQLAEAQRLHDGLLVALRAANLPDLAQQEELRYQPLRLATLEKSDPAQFLTEAQAQLTLDHPVTATEALVLQDLARRSYTPLLNAGRLADAKALHARLKTALQQANLPETVQADEVQYQTAYLATLEKTQSTQFLSEAKVVLAAAKTAQAWPEAQVAAGLAPRVYPALYAAGQGGDVDTVHAGLQAALKAMSQPEQARLEALAYLTARLGSLERTDPATFLTEALAQFTATRAVTTGDLPFLVDLARRSYGPLYTAGRGAEAKTAHEQLAAWMGKLGTADQQLLEKTLYLGARLAYLEKTQPPLFQTEALAHLTVGGRQLMLSEVPFLLDLARRTYGPLTVAGRADELKPVHEQLQAALAKMATADQVQAEAFLYRAAQLNALEKLQPALFLTQASALVSALTGASPLIELQFGASVTPRLYPALITAGKLAEAQRVHEALSTALRAANLSDLAQKDDQVYQPLRLAALEKSDPTQFLTEAHTLVTLDHPVTAAEAPGLQDLARRMYSPLLSTGRPADAKALHEKLKTALLQAKLPEAAQADDIQYQTVSLANLEKSQPAQFLREATQIMTTAKTARVWSEAQVAVSLAPRVYPALFAAGQGADAEAAHAGLQSALTTMNQPEQARLEAQAYLTARLGNLERTAPAQFLTEAQGVLAAAKTAQSWPEAQLAAGLAPRVYLALYASGQGAAADTLHAGLRSALTTMNQAEPARVEGLAYLTVRLGSLERTDVPAFLTEALAQFAPARPVTPGDLLFLLDLGRRAYGPLYIAGRGAEAKTAHEQLAAWVAKFGTPDQQVAEKIQYYTARLAALEKTLPAQFQSETLALLTVGGRQLTVAEVPFLLDIARRTYGPLAAAGHLEDVQATHAQLQTALAKVATPEQLQAENTAYRAAQLGAIEKTQPSQFLTDGMAVIRTLQQAKNPNDVPLALSLAPRIYQALSLAGQQDTVTSLHTGLNATLVAMGQPDQALNEQGTYLAVFYGAVNRMLLAPNLTAEQVATLKRQCEESWTATPLLAADRVLPLVRDRLVNATVAADWYPAYARFVTQLPVDQLSRSTLLYLQAQWAQRLALTARVRGENGTALEAQAEHAWLDLIATYPSDARIPTVLASLVTMYQSAGRTKDVEAILTKIGQRQPSPETLAWLADSAFQLGTASGYQQAGTWYAQLLASQPTHALCPVWQYKVARCHEQAAHLPEALAAYQKVIDSYPDSSAVVAALRKIDQLKGGK